jgi:hypothetical protein
MAQHALESFVHSRRVPVLCSYLLDLGPRSSIAEQEDDFMGFSGCEFDRYLNGSTRIQTGAIVPG